MENEILYIKKYPNAKDSYLESTILSMKELELLFHKVLKKNKIICSTNEFANIMNLTINNEKINEYIFEPFEKKLNNAIKKTVFKKKIITEIEKEFKIRLKKGRLKNFEKSHSDAMKYNGYDILINYLRICKMCAITKIVIDNHMFINCNEEPYDIDDVNTPISYTDMSAFM